MTNKVAIAFLEGLKTYQLRTEREAIDMAIEALEQERYDDCISRQSAIDAVIYDGITTLNADERKLLIEQLPSAEPKRGKWNTVIRHEHYPSGREYEADYCSECGRRGSLEYLYCPFCGARMESDGE